MNEAELDAIEDAVKASPDTVLAVIDEVRRLRNALAHIHDWAALGGEHGEEPDARIMRFAAAVLDQPGVDPDTWA